MTWPVPPPVLSRRVRVWRGVLLAGGLALLAVGAVVVGTQVNPRTYAGILIWLIGALILHDGIIAPLIVLVTLLLRRTRASQGVIALVQGGLVLAGLMVLLVVPEILKQRIQVASSSILPQDYLTHLVVYVVAVALLTAAAVAIYRVVARTGRSAQKTRPSSTQS